MVKKENALANDRILYECWVITDIDEETNEGYGAERTVFPFDENFNLPGYTFKTKEKAEEVLKGWFGKNGFNVVSSKAEVMKASVLISITNVLT